MADRKRGLIMVNTGNGKGKTTAAFGVIARASGYGLRCGIIQFIKSNRSTGEYKFAARDVNIEIHTMGRGFTWNSEDLEKDKDTARAAWHKASEMIDSGNFDIILLDEITYAINYKFLEIEPILQKLKQRPPTLHIIITGRDCPGPIMDLADQVTEMVNVKHPFDQGELAQRGIDY